MSCGDAVIKCKVTRSPNLNTTNLAKCKTECVKNNKLYCCRLYRIISLHWVFRSIMLNICQLIKSIKIPFFFRFSSGMFSIIKKIRFILKQTSHDLQRLHDRQHLETPKINVIMFTKTEIIIKGKMIILKAAERRSSFFLLILINHWIFLGYLYTNM